MPESLGNSSQHELCRLASGEVHPACGKGWDHVHWDRRDDRANRSD